MLSPITNKLSSIFTTLSHLAENIIDGIGDFLGRIIDNIKELASSLKDWFGGLSSSLGNWFSSLFSHILALPTTIVEGFKDLLRTLFVPSDGFIDSKMTSLKAKMTERFHMETYEQLLTALKGHVAGNLNFGGYIDLEIWTKHLPTVKDFIRGFFYPIILIGDYRFLIWIIRGSASSAVGN